MKVRSILMSVALLIMLAVPAMAQNGSDDHDTVTKTFKLTLNGDVPEGQGFSVNYNLDDDPFGEGFFAFCGPQGLVARGVSIEPCEGNGTAYSRSVEFERGTTIVYNYLYSPGGDEPDQPFAVGKETLDADMTNTSEYTFGRGVGDDKQDDTQDGTQGETPGEMPDTGAGALAPGASIPVGNVAAGLTMLAGASYAVLRRR